MKKLLLSIILVNLVFAKIGLISYIEGNATIIRNDLNITAKKNTPLEVNDTVVTFNKSFVKMKFNDNTIISLGANSKFQIKEYIFNKQKPSAKFKFFKGVFRSVTGKIGKIAPKRFKLQTKNVSIGIRGTIVLGKILNGNNLIMCESGVIDVINVNTKKSVILKAGEGIVMAGNFVSNVIKMPFKLIKGIFDSIFTPLEKEEKFNKKSIQNKIKNQNKKVITKKFIKNELNISKNKDINISDLNWSKYIIEPLNKKYKLHKEKGDMNFDNDIYDMKLLLKGN